ncbi:head-tail adaptor [Anabaena phage A-4L]|uniref:Portal protein n=1 Tax=Anabaena phage A-4L TaxID=1357732 RepID=A0A059PYA9_9CAUD|nr:head-tail adaptor [Anabaena phage A-4L]AGR48562.1 portal protein [Anabaena phage A-4L]
MIRIKDFNHVITGREQPLDINEAIASYITSRYVYFKDARRVAEETWLEAWSLYSGTPEAVDHQRTQTINTVGEVNNDWRHRLNTGKAYECIETVHGYLMGALFPNREWFDLTPNNPGYANEARIIRKYLTKKFNEGKFRVSFEKYLRQLLVCGYSVMALPWRYESRPYKYNVTIKREENEYYDNSTQKANYRTVTENRVTRNAPEFECLDVFDVYLSPTSNDPNESDFIRRIKKTRADIITAIKRGYYTDIDPYDIVNMSAYEVNDRVDKLTSFQGIETNHPYCMDDIIEVVEYWGDLHLDGVSLYDVKATVIGQTLVCCEPNPFWAGKPFVVGSITELPETPYSVGLLQPNMGLLHQLNIITNQRCDNLELAIDEMWTLVQNSSLNPDEVQVAPGKVFLVDSHDDLRPIQRGGNNFVVSYQEAGLLESTIDRNTGTGNLISANASRSGERVTAAEIQAVRDAGGNRLSNIHRHIEDTSLMEILRRVYRSAQQFVTEPEMIRVSGAKPGEYLFLEVDPESLNKEYSLEPIGADFVTDATKYVRQRMDFIAFASQIPQMAERLNYEALLNDVVNHSGFDDPYSYIVKPQQPAPQPDMGATPEPQTGQAPPDEQTNPFYDIGGVSLQNAIGANIQADGANELINFTTGVNTNADQ